MKAIIAYFRMLRWPNLIFIALTQFLFFYQVFDSLHPVRLSLKEIAQNPWLYLLMLASVLIAGAGYVINDYFDVQIDQINKPDKVFIDQAIKRRWAIFWHGIMSGTGLFISFIISRETEVWIIFWGNFACILLLWFYSTHLKRKLLWGNLTIALLTAWTIIVVYFFSGGKFINYRHSFDYNINHWVKLTILYSGFAFVLTLVREAVKDLEDILGDEKYGCQTMPLQWGITATKVFAGVWLSVAFSGLSILGFYLLQKGMIWIGLYTIGLLVFPLALQIKKLKEAKQKKDYHQISTVLKLLMLAGILSMLFF